MRRQLDELPEWLTCAQVATLTRLSERSVDRAIVTGRLEAADRDGSVRIHRSAVTAWLVPSPGR
jgi:excisionase family DNA binding protein